MLVSLLKFEAHSPPLLKGRSRFIVDKDIRGRDAVHKPTTHWLLTCFNRAIANIGITMNDLSPPGCSLLVSHQPCVTNERLTCHKKQIR